MTDRDKFKVGDRVRDTVDGDTGTIEDTDGDGIPLVRWDGGASGHMEDSELEALLDTIAEGHAGKLPTASYSFQIKPTDGTVWSELGFIEPSPAPEPDMVNHPPHYNRDPSGVECIEVIRFRTFNIGNAIKYLWRAGLKGDPSKEVEDLRKAVFYINDEIERLTAQ